MRKRISVVLILSMVFALSACEKQTEPDESQAMSEVVANPKESLVDIQESAEMIATEKFDKPDDPDLSKENQNNNDQIIDRVISRFEDQCLEWYYSDCVIRCDHEIRNGRVFNNTWYIPLEPGTKLYYRIQTNKQQTGYRITCSDDETFNHSFAWIYAYFPKEDVVTQIEHEFTFESDYQSGSFLIPETFSSTNEANDQESQTLFYTFWNEWLTEKSSEELESPVKNAYLMPFKTEEDGTATFRVYIEEENGVWILARASARLSQTDTTSAKQEEINWGDILFGNYTFSPFQWWEEDASNYWNENVSENGELVVARAYIPSASNYSVYTYELYKSTATPDGSENNYLFGQVRAKETGEFLSMVPDLALTKLQNKD